MKTTRNNPGKGLRHRTADNKAVTKSIKKSLAKPIGKIVRESFKKADTTIMVTTKQNEPGECFNYDKKGREDLQTFLLGLNGGEPITFLTDDRFERIQSKIQLAPVAVLQQESGYKFFGVYAKEALKSGLNLGEYLGEKKSIKGTNETTNVDYAFDLKNKYEINAKYKRSWHAMVNSVSAGDIANVQAQLEDGHIHYYAVRDIKPGEQLLIYYGDDYKFADKRFLNSHDNWEDSAKIIEKNARYYQMNEQLPERVRVFFELSYEQFAVPDAKIINKNSVDLPLLGFDKWGQIVPQSHQDNITLLHIACFNGDIALTERLLTIGANINRQTSITGLSPLHCAIMSKMPSFEDKKRLLDLFLNNQNISFNLQDKHDRSLLHLAIESEEVELIKYLLDVDKQRNPQKSLKRFITEKSQCYLLLSIEKHNINILNVLVDYISPNDINYYLKSDQSHLLKQALNDACQKSTYAEWDVIRKWVQALVKKSKDKDGLNELMPIHLDEPVVITSPKLTAVKSQLIQGVAPLKGVKRRHAEIKPIAKKPPPGKPWFIRYVGVKPVTSQPKVVVELNEEAIVKSIVESKKSPAQTFIDSLQSNQLRLYKTNRALMNWLGDNNAEISRELPQIVSSQHDSCVKSAENAKNLIFQFGVIAKFYLTGQKKVDVQEYLTSRPYLLKSIVEHWSYAFICASVYDKDVISFMVNNAIKQRTQQQFAKYNNDVDKMVNDIAAYAKDNVFFINEPHVLVKLNLNGMEQIKNRLNVTLQFLFESYLHQDALEQQAIAKLFENNGSVSDVHNDLVKKVIESQLNAGQLFIALFDRGQADLYKKNRDLLQWFEKNRCLIGQELTHLSLSTVRSYAVVNVCFNNLNQLLHVRDYYFFDDAQLSNPDSKPLPGLLDSLATQWRFAFFCAALRHYHPDVLLRVFLRDEPTRQVIEKELANYNNDIERMASELVIDVKEYSGFFYNDLGPVRLIEIAESARTSFKNQLEYLVAYYQSEKDISAIAPVTQSALNLHQGKFLQASEEVIIKDIQESKMSHGQTFFKTVELNQQYLYRKSLPLVLWFSKYCQSIEQELTALGQSNNLSFQLFKMGFDEVNQLIEIEGYFYAGPGKTTWLAELDSKMRPYILNHWHFAFISAVCFNNTDLFINDAAIKELTQEHCLAYNGNFELMAHDLALYAKENAYFLSNESDIKVLRIKLKNKLQALSAQFDLEYDLDSTMSDSSSLQNGSR